MKQLLLATDFSELAQPAAIWAGHVAKASGAKLTLFYVHHLGLLEHTDAGKRGPNPEDTAWAEKEFGALRDLIESETGYKNPEGIMINGYPVEEIINYAHQQNIDLVVCGSHGAGRANSFFGSNTAALIEAAHPPVLAVPPKAGFHGPVKRVLFSEDLRTVDLSSFLQLMRFAGIFQAEVHFLHSSDAAANLTDRLLLRSLIRDLPEVVPCAGGFQAEELPNVKNEQEFIEQTKLYMRERDIGVVCMLTHEPTWWQRVIGHDLAKEMPFTDDVPMLALHPLGRLTAGK